jgi:hypothetical protein
MEQKLIEQVADLMLDARCNHWEASSMSREALIRCALERTDGNICQAAKLIGMHRNSFTRCLSELGIRRLPREIRDRRHDERRPQQLVLWKQPNGRRQPSSVWSVRDQSAQRFA